MHRALQASHASPSRPSSAFPGWEDPYASSSSLRPFGFVASVPDTLFEEEAVFLHDLSAGSLSSEVSPESPVLELSPSRSLSGWSGVDRMVVPCLLDHLQAVVDDRLFRTHYDDCGLERPFAYTHPISGYVSAFPGSSSSSVPLPSSLSEASVDSLRWQQRQRSRAVRCRRQDRRRHLQAEQCLRRQRHELRVPFPPVADPSLQPSRPFDWSSLFWVFFPIFCALFAGMACPLLWDSVVSPLASGARSLAVSLSSVPPQVPSPCPLLWDPWTIFTGLYGAFSVLSQCFAACLQRPLRSGASSFCPGWAEPPWSHRSSRRDRRRRLQAEHRLRRTRPALRPVAASPLPSLSSPPSVSVGLSLLWLFFPPFCALFAGMACPPLWASVASSFASGVQSLALFPWYSVASSLASGAQSLALSLWDSVASSFSSGTQSLALSLSLVPTLVLSPCPLLWDPWTIFVGVCVAFSVLPQCFVACMQCPLRSGASSNLSMEFHLRPGWAVPPRSSGASGVHPVLSQGLRAADSDTLAGLGSDDNDLSPLPFQYVRFSVERASGAVVGHCRWYRPSSHQLPFLSLDPWGQLCSLQPEVVCPVLQEVLRHNLPEDRLSEQFLYLDHPDLPRLILSGNPYQVEPCYAYWVGTFDWAPALAVLPADTPILRSPSVHTLGPVYVDLSPDEIQLLALFPALVRPLPLGLTAAAFRALEARDDAERAVARSVPDALEDPIVSPAPLPRPLSPLWLDDEDVDPAI